MDTFDNLTHVVRKTAAKAFAVGKMQFELSLILPPKHRIEAAFIVLSGTSNVPAAGVTSEQQTRLLNLAECERRLRIDGNGLNALDWQFTGRDFDRPAALAQNAAAPTSVTWMLDWRDRRGIEPSDAVPATDFYLGKMLDLTFADPAGLVAAWAMNAGVTVQVEFHLSPLPVGDVPASTVINFVEYAGRETKLPGGLDYLDIALVKNDGSACTDAELGNIALTVDSKLQVIESNTRLATLVRAFNRFIARGSQVQGATDGVEGEAMDPASVPFVPLRFPLPPYKATKLMRVASQAVLTTDGTLAAGAARVYYRALEVRSEDKVLLGAAKIGWNITTASRARPKTSSKNGVTRERGFLSGMAARVTNLFR